MLDRLRKLLEDAAAADERLKVIRKRMEQGKAAFADTAEYSDRLSNLLGEILAAHVEHLTQPKEKETICKQLLKEHYARINKVLANVQLDLDQQREIHIRPQQAAFPAERVQKVAHALEDPTVSLDTIRRRANAPVANVAKSFHDDYIQANAKFRAEAGLKCWIVRTTDGNCCKWCTEVAGRYEYGSEPGDVYRRHDNCGCTTVYENGRQRQDVWSKKKWEVPEAGAGAPKPTILTPAQGRALQAKHKPTVLTRGRRSGIIVTEDSPRKIGTGRFSVDWSVVQSSQYSAKFDRLSDNPKVARSIETRAKWALNNRTGTKTEELYAVSLLDGTEIARIADQRIDSGVKRTVDFTRKLYEADQRGEKVLLIHNHPRGLPPSIGDINALLEHFNVSGITVGHDGSVYRYTRPKATIPQTEWDVAMRHFSGYSESTAMEKALELLSSKYQFEIEIL